MKSRYSLENSVLKPFFEEINKYEKGIHKLNEGVDINLIETLEKHLTIKLPLVYKEFLEICNGGEIFAIPAGTIFSEIFDFSKGNEKPNGYYLNDIFKPERRWTDMPQEYIIIADTNYGDTICLNLSKNDGSEAEIVKWSHEEAEVSNRWDRLIDWLMDELEIGSMLVNYDGSEKDLFC